MSYALDTVVRYVRLFGYFVAFAFSQSFEFRFDFYMRIIMDICYYAVAFGFFKVLFLHTPELGGWNEPQMMIFIASYCMVDAINMTLFSNNMWQIPTLVNRGDLDYYLLRPVSSLFFVSLRSFAANSFLNLVITAGMMTWAIERYPVPIPPLKLLLFFLLLINGSILFYCINMMANITVFWTHSPNGMGELVWGMMKFGERPDRIYTGWTRRVLTLALPFCLLASYPARLALEEFDIWILVQILAVTAAFFGLLLWMWSRALENYSSASS